jgi:putative MATE family efflux protein
VRDAVLEGPLYRSVLRIAVPAAAGQLLMFANNLADQWWVSRLGREATAGLTTGMTTFWMLTAVGQIFATGITAVVARRVGGGRGREAVAAATYGTKGALCASLLVAAAGVLLAPALVAAGGASAEAQRHAREYLYALFLGAPVLFLFHAAEGTFRGRGDARTPLRALAIALGLNIVLDPLLIFGARLGVLGAGLATTAALGLTGALLAWSALRRGFLDLRVRRLGLPVVGRIVAIGTPLSIHGVVFSLVYRVLIGQTSRAGGDAATAALGWGIRFEGVAYMASAGCAAAAATIVGQALGAGSPLRARDGAWAAVRLAVLVSAFWGLVMFAAPERLVLAMVGGDAGIAAFTVDYFRIVGACLAFMAVEIVLEGAFSGAGSTLPPMLLASAITVARVPLAVLFASRLGWGVAGVFWVIHWTCVGRGLILAFWFARGRWVKGRA